MSETSILEDYLELVTYGFTNPMPDSDEGPWKITAKDVIDGEINFNTARKTTQKAFDTKLTKKSRPKIGDVLLTKDGTLGRLAIVQQEGICINQSVAVLRPNEKILPEYLFYLLSTPEYQRKMIGDSDGTVIKHIYITRVGKMEVDIPSIEEQKERLKHLLAVDGKIKLNRQINQTLEQIAQAIFKSWFVDFEPVKAKVIAREKGGNELAQSLAAQAIISGAVTLEQLENMEASYRGLEDELHPLITNRFPDQYGVDYWTPETLEQLAALFPDELEASELGEIPKGWSKRKISNWGNVVCGKTPPKKDTSNYGGDIPFIKIPDMHGNVFATLTNDTLSARGAETQKKKQIPKDSICVSCIATVGQVVITSEDSHTNQQINSIVPKNMEHTPYLYFCLLERKGLLHDLASGGSATLNLNTGNFSKIPLVYPSDKSLSEYSRIAVPMFESILGKEWQTQNLSEIRDAFLPKLLSGEITLGDTQSTKEAVA